MPKSYRKNPRQITLKQFDSLSDSLARLGDLSGVVHDLNTDEIIGGNQRIKVFGIDNCEIELVQTFDEPDAQGTVAQGFIVWEGKRYSYRQVRWNERQAEEANIVANRAGGSWDYDILANEFDIEDLLTWGFEERDFKVDLDAILDVAPESEEEAGDDEEDEDAAVGDDSLIAMVDVTIAYVPSGKVLGLSKFGRIAHKWAHKLQLQEQLASQILDDVSHIVGSDDVAIFVQGEHLCMTMRGVKTPAKMTTTIMRGAFEEPANRSEFLSLLKVGGAV